MIKIKRAIEEKYNNLMIVDSLNLAFRYKWKGDNNFAGDYAATVDSLAKSYKANKVVILGDWGSAWRTEFYPEYKANRTELREKQTDQEADDFQEFLEELNNAYILLGQEGYPIIRMRGVEADDLAAYIVDNWTRDYDHIWLISSDKDWNLLVSNKVSQFSYVNRKETTLANWPHNCEIEQYIDLKILQGDAGDNVSKPEGLGPKRAEELLRQYPSVWDMHFPIDSTLKYIHNLNVFEAHGGIERNYKLMSLLDFYEEAIGEDNIQELESILGDYL